MADWYHAVAMVASQVEEHFDRLKYGLVYRLHGLDPVNVLIYNGYGDRQRIHIKGRVLVNKGELESRDNDTLWRNLINMYRRLESDEVPFAELIVRAGGAETRVKADEEGYFQTWLDLANPVPEGNLWQEVEAELLHPIPENQPGPIKGTGKALIPPPTARFAVISDIDDTVVQTDAAHLVRMARHVFLGNARTRLPFPGVAAFYRALLDGAHGNDLNPLFYVSSSPWNLYDLLVDFFGLQNIPLGPVLFLRDWGLTPEEILPVDNRNYKMKVIRELMDFYHEMPFILIGDSGQEDPEIYQEVVASYPGRVLAVYIRNVSRDLKRPEAIKMLAQEVLQHGSTLILADDTLSIARHASEKGWIASQSLHGIQFEKSKDEAPPSPVEKLLAGEPKAEGPTVSVEGQKSEAVEQGAIEAALKTGEEKKEKPPTVVVKSDQEPESPPGQGQDR